jgi:hypothetical protein
VLAARKSAFRILQNAENTIILSDPKSKIIMAFLGVYGPQSIPSIQKKIKAYCKALKLRNPTSDFSIKLDYMEIKRKIEPLKNAGLIKEPHYYFHKTSTRIIGLTFKGLIWYFREPSTHSKRKIDRFFKSYREPYVYKSKHRKNRFLLESYRQLIPFCPLWKGMVKQVGDKCLDRLSMTVKNFYVGEKTFSKIEPLELEVETFPNYSGECTDRIYHFERDNVVVDYLRSEEATLLREAYISYLINEDLNLLSQMGADEVKQNLPKLKSVKEYAFFENGQKIGAYLFSRKGLAMFFPKYSGIEYFFAGMFVNNLLWNEKQTTEDKEKVN